jgi:hypothetical protein
MSGVIACSVRYPAIAKITSTAEIAAQSCYSPSVAPRSHSGHDVPLTSHQPLGSVLAGSARSTPWRVVTAEA